MNRERKKKAIDLCVEFVNLFELDEKHKFDLTNKIGSIYQLGEHYEDEK